MTLVKWIVGHVPTDLRDAFDDAQQQWTGLAAAACAIIVKAAHATIWGGYSGYFQDPDGHLWEVVGNPAWEG